MIKEQVIDTFEKAIKCEQTISCEDVCCDECEHHVTRAKEIEAMEFVLKYFKE